MMRLTLFLAWAQLARDERRLAAGVAGIAFAVMLMLTQLGFRDALYKSATLIHSHLAGDLVMISPQYDYLGASKMFSRRRLYQALGCAEVGSVTPLYFGVGRWKNPENGRERSIFVIAFDPALPALDLPGLAVAQLHEPDVVLFDTSSRREFGAVGDLFRRRGELLSEIESHRVRVGGLFILGTSFTADGNLVTSDLNFLRIFPNRTQGLIDAGLIRLRPGADPERVCGEIARSIPNDVRVLTRPQFIELERHYWKTSTPIGFVFALGLAVGMVVGFVFVYQVLYSDVIDHLPEYATLKAIGHSDLHLVLVVFNEAIILSLLGFIPGWLISIGLYAVARDATLLPMAMTFGRTIFVLLLTMLMCAASGALAMRKLREADPADIF